MFIDITVAGELHNLLKRPTIASMLIGARLDRCRGAIVSIRSKSWSAAHLMPKPDGEPGTALRSFPDAIEGIPRADGTLPRSVVEGNTETEHITEVCHAIAKHGGFLIVEMPTPGGAPAPRSSLTWHSKDVRDTHTCSTTVPGCS